MAKTEKYGNRKPKKNEDPPAPPRGRLVALEGASAALLRPEAERLARLCCGAHDPAWSLWDASNTFYEMRLAKAHKLTPTPRTLILLYASDLLFRLRWEIEPALQEGRTVVAAPYLESVVAFGLAGGLPKEWLEELFRFAPQPTAVFRVKEKKKLKDKKKQEEGFTEFCCKALARNFPGWQLDEIRGGMLEYLDSLEESERILPFGKKVHQIKRALT